MSGFGERKDDSGETGEELEFGADDARHRGMPTSLASSNDEETFTLNELESDMTRSLGTSSSYEPRSVQVASNYRADDGLSGFDVAYSAASHHKQYVDNNVASFSPASMDVIVPEPQPVPAAPYHLDMNTHDVRKSSVNASKIHIMLCETFDSNNVDVLFRPHSWLFVAKAYPNNELVDFRVRLYNTDQDVYKLEFQLRDGDRVSYYQLLNKMKHDLNLPTNGVSFGYEHFRQNLPSSSTSSSTSSTKTPSEENIKQVVKMIDSKYVDVKIEGLKLAYQFCANKIILPIFVRHSGIAAILTAVQTERNEMEVQRCGASTLHMYCSTDDTGGCDALLKAPKGMETVIRLARMSGGGNSRQSSGGALSFFEEEDDDDDDMTHLEVQRQATSALLCLARRSADAARIIEENRGAEVFQELQKSGDPRLNEIATKAIEHLPSARTHY